MALAEALTVGGAKTQAVQLLDNYIGEVGKRSKDLRIAPSILRRRIGERVYGYHHEPQSLSPFVGRDSEMRVLHQQLRFAIEGESQCVAIVGEAGIGKTRLVTEFCQLMALDGVNVAFTDAQPHDIHRPFGAFADLFQKLIGMPGALGVSPDSMSLLQRLVTSPSTDASAFANAVRESDSFSHAITHAIIDLIDSITSEGSLLMSVDDIPSLDRMSLRLFGYLLSGSRRRRLCVLVTSRDAGAIASIPANHLTTIDLHGVDAHAVARLVETFAERAAVEVDAEMAQWLQDTSAGHPFFLESLLAHYSSTGERFSISPSLSSLLRQRMDSLSDRGTATLQTCSILGKFATPDTIVEATQLTRFELVRGIRELEISRLIRIDGQQVRPIHALVSDVVLQRMTPLERRLTHQCAALALEKKIGVDHSAALVWDCAEHWYAAGNINRALAAIQRCASHAVDMGRPEAAAQMLARALTLSLSPPERANIARHLVAAADEAMDSDLVLQAIGILEGSRRGSPHDELEFAEFRARTRIYSDGLGQEKMLMKCVADPTASADHRVIAATLLLKYADSTLNRDLSLRAISALPAPIVLAATDLVRLEYLMIAHSARDEFDDAARLARALLAAVDDASLIIRLHLSLNAVLALDRAGFSDEAARIAEQRYSEAGNAGAPHLRLLLATFLSEHFYDTIDEERSAKWRDTMDAIVEDYPTLGNQVAQRLSRASAALTARDVAGAKKIIDEMDRDGLLEGGLIRNRWRKVALLRLGQLEGVGEISGHDLQAIMAGAQQGSAVGGICDAEAALVCHELLRTGNISEAKRFFDTFTQEFRRSRAPLARCLTEASSAISAHAEREPRSGAPHHLRLSDANQPRRRLSHNSQRSDGSFVAGGREQSVPERT